MALANAIALLKIVGPLAAVVPVFGPQLEALINVANELCVVADVRTILVSRMHSIESHDLQGIKSNREGLVKLANEAAVYAAAVADRVQRSHPPMPPETLDGLSVPADLTEPVESTSARIGYSTKHVQALTEYVTECVISEKHGLIVTIVQDTERDREGDLWAEGKRCCAGEEVWKALTSRSSRHLEKGERPRDAQRPSRETTPRRKSIFCE